MADGKTASKATSKLQSQDIVITRVFDAPLEQVWQAWKDPEIMKKWWGPKGYTAPVIKIDFYEGGHWLTEMRSPDGKEIWSAGQYTDIIPFKEITTTDSFADENGDIVPPSYYGLTSTNPDEYLLTAKFEDYNGKTRLNIRHSGFRPGEERDNTITGWNQQLDKLEKVLANKEDATMAKAVFTAPTGVQEVTLTRIFNAPRDVVFKAYTNPDLIPQFWGPAEMNTEVLKMDLRPGGMWRFIQRDARGNDFAFHGFYHTVSPERMVYTFEYEGMPGHVMLETVDFINQDGMTKVVATDVFQSMADRDAMVDSGMERGAVETMERFAKVLEKQAR